jgi:hypothetical protein
MRMIHTRQKEKLLAKETRNTRLDLTVLDKRRNLYRFVNRGGDYLLGFARVISNSNTESSVHRLFEIKFFSSAHLVVGS